MRDPSGYQGTCEEEECNPPGAAAQDPSSSYPQVWGEYAEFGTTIIFSGDSGRPVSVTQQWQTVDVAESGQILISTGITPTMIYPMDPYIADGIVAVALSNGAAFNVLYYRGQDIERILAYMGAYAIGSFTNQEINEQYIADIATYPFVDPILRALAQGQCLDTPDPSGKTCDPTKVIEWMLRNPGVTERRGLGDNGIYDYQRYYAGNVVYEVRTGMGRPVHPDGVRPFDCAMLDTKYVEDPNNSPFVLGSRVRENAGAQRAVLSRRIDPQEDDLFKRYSYALRASEDINPFTSLEIITNEPRSFSYWQYWINKNNVPNATIVIRPWPI